MGTLTKYDNEEFRETYGSVYYQPRRKMIMDHVAELQEELDSYISEYNEKPLKTINETDFVLAKIGKKIINFYSSGKQKHYYSFNMVDVYNQYKMFICPEDVQGSYGIGVIEGMACGCAMIGLTYGAFEDIGMCAGEHYIPYDGSIQDLKAKIQYYQEPQHQKELEKIAKQGCEFVRAHFSQNTVAENYFNTLKDLTCSKN